MTQEHEGVLTEEAYAAAKVAVEAQSTKIRETIDILIPMSQDGYTFPGYTMEADNMNKATFTEILDTGENGKILRANHLVWNWNTQGFTEEVTRPAAELGRQGSEPIRERSLNHSRRPGVHFDPLLLLQGMIAVAQSSETSPAE